MPDRLLWCDNKRKGFIGYSDVPNAFIISNRELARQVRKGRNANACSERTTTGRSNTDGTRLSSRRAHKLIKTAHNSMNIQGQHGIRQFFPRRTFLCGILRLTIVAATFFSIGVQTISSTKWCDTDKEPLDNSIEICLEPSVGPMDGGVLVTIKGMQRAAASHPTFSDLSTGQSLSTLADWKSKCNQTSWWQCTFAGTDGSKGRPLLAKASSCLGNYVVCESPEQHMSGDVFISVSRNDSAFTFPSPPGRNEIFAYYGVAKIEPIAGVARMRPAVDIVMLNRKEGVESWNCKYIPHGPGWNKSNAVPPIRAAGFKLETKRLTCGIPDDILLLEDGAPLAELYIEVAEVQTSASQNNPTYTRSKKEFTLVRPYTIQRIDYKTSPYSGGTQIRVTGEGFQSFPRLACQLTWCLDFQDEPSCRTARFLSAHFISNTTVQCTTDAYAPLDVDCNELCLPGGPEAGYRGIASVSNKKLRQDQTIHCCGDTCCTESARLQITLDGGQFVPTFDNRDAPFYVNFAGAPLVSMAMYVDPVVKGIFPLTGPMKGLISVTVFGLNFWTASMSFSQNLTFCRFRIREQGASSLSWMWSIASFLTDNSLWCVTPATTASVSTEVGITFNGQNFQSNPIVNFAYFSVDRVDPPFGGFLGGTEVMISGKFLDAMRPVANSAKYRCKFSDVNRTIDVIASFQLPSYIVCTVPDGRIGKTHLSVSQHISDNENESSYSNDPTYFQYVDEVLVYKSEPGTGPRSGGYSVIVSGKNIMNSSLLACRFKLEPGLNVVVRGAQYISPTQASCIVPQSDLSGMARIYLLNNGQQDSVTFAEFIYYTVVDVLPDGGPVMGDTEVRVTVSTDTTTGWCRFGTPEHTVEAIVVQNLKHDIKNSFFTKEEMKICYRTINRTNDSNGSSGSNVNWTKRNTTNITTDETYPFAALGNCSTCACSSSGRSSFQTPYVATPTAGVLDIKSCQNCSCNTSGVIPGANLNCTTCTCKPQACLCSCELMAPLNSTYPCLQNVTHRNYTSGRVLVCRTRRGMSPSIYGAEVPFSVSLNNRDYAVPADFGVFTFYPEQIVDRLLPESGPLRGGTGVTVVGTSFFTLCRTAHDDITGRCFGCNDQSLDTFLWTPQSSCTVTIPGSETRGKLPWPSDRRCGLPCRPGFDDRDTFGVTGTIFCSFGSSGEARFKVRARFMTLNRVKCLAPRTPNAEVASRLPVEVTFNDQQYTSFDNLFSYYTITSVSPTTVPTYGGSIVSVKGHNLFSGARKGLEVQCLFWLDIYTLGAYDPENDCVYCLVPEQPAEMRDNLIVAIDFAVSLNLNIKDQFTDERQSVFYEFDDMPILMYPWKGPMNGGMQVVLELPLRLNPQVDEVHVGFPFNYKHIFSQRFRNDIAQKDRRTACFGTIRTVKHKILQNVLYTCCENVQTETVCDGPVVPAIYANSSFLEINLPPYSTPQTVNVDVALNGIRNGSYNPTAQYSKQAVCAMKINKCVQANRDSRCLQDIDCGGLMFRYWGIQEVFPVAFDVTGKRSDGQTLTVRLLGNNFPHIEDDPGFCVWFKYSDDTQFAKPALSLDENDCDQCEARDENDKCMHERYCRAVICDVPPAPGGTAIGAYVEIIYGNYPITTQRQKVQYYNSASVVRLDISAGPLTGGTKIVVRGINFVNSSRLFCQFANGQQFSSGRSFSQAYFVDSNTLKCTAPMCISEFVGAAPNGTCDQCGDCNVPVRITMNFRDFLPGNTSFVYRLIPEINSVAPIRAPAQIELKTSVTVAGLFFSNVGAANRVGYGLSCRFGRSTVQARFHSSCTSALCTTVTCIPPQNSFSEIVHVLVGIDTQQWRGVLTPSGWKPTFAYYTITKLHPPYVLTTGGAVLAVNGVNVDYGRAYACKISNYSSVNYSSAIAIDDSTVGCTVPPLELGFYNVSISLDDDDVQLQDRDYTGKSLAFENYVPPLVVEIKPTKGEAKGGVAVTLMGRNFWNSPFLVCLFGKIRSVAAVFVNNETVVCTSPEQFGPVDLELSLNGQEFSKNSRIFVNYYVAVVQQVIPARIPAGYSRDIIVRGLFFEDFQEAACIFDVIDDRINEVYVRAFYVNSSTYRCQCPVGIQGTRFSIKVTLDSVEKSRSSTTLFVYDVNKMQPFVGPTFGGTRVVIDGYYLNEGDRPVCQYATQVGLDVNGSKSDTIYFIEVLSGGVNYTDGHFPLVMGSCVENQDVVYGIDIKTLGSDYTDGLYTLNVKCVPPCNGSGLVAMYKVVGEVVREVILIEGGTGYNISHPPVVEVRGCDGVGGSGTCTPVEFKVKMGRSCVRPGCCQNKIKGTYSVLNGKVQSATIVDGGGGFNQDFPPEVTFNSCNGAATSGGRGCKVCSGGLSVPSGTCSTGALCGCSGVNNVYCQDGTRGTSLCRCTVANNGMPCMSDAECTGTGTCKHSAKLRVLVANVTQMPGTRNQNNDVVCEIPRVKWPDSVEGFFQRQSIDKQYYGIARMFVKIRIHAGDEFTAKSLIYHFHDPSSVSNVYPNSASSRGGSQVTVTGRLFKRETGLTTVRLPDDSEETIEDMHITCRLHHSLHSQPGIFVNSTHVYCAANRVCFFGSTMSGCQECILEGCDQPTLDYSHSLPTNTFFSAQVALNDQDFADNGVPFYVYSVSSFRPFGGVYNGGTHVSIAGINFDRGGAGPYDAHCSFARIVVPARWDPVEQLVKCVSQPLLDIYTVLEVHLGTNLSDTSLWTDNRHIFNMYTAYPPGLVVSPDTGSFTGKQPLRFEVPRPHQFNHFRFRALDFHTNFEGVEATLLVKGQRDDDPRTDLQLITIARIISMELNLYMCLAQSGCMGRETACLKQCKIQTQHCIWERICDEWLGYKRDCDCRYPALLSKTYVEDSDVVFGLRRRIDEKTFELNVRIEPTDEPNKIEHALQYVLRSDTINRMMRSDWVQKSIFILGHPSLDHLNITERVPPATFRFFSEYAAFARFGSLATEGWVSELSSMEAEIATAPVNSPATLLVSFCMNGQQFSLQPISFYYYTVNWVVPFGVPVSYPTNLGVDVDKTKWLSCPDASNFCQSTITFDIGARLATIRIYGSNFRSQSRPVKGAIYSTPKCRYGSFDDKASQFIGKELESLEIVDGTINYEFGYVECLQPAAISLRSLHDPADTVRRIRVEVALNGRDFSFSALDANGPMGLVLFDEPVVLAYEPIIGPITGNTAIVITGENFRREASDWKTPTCFCLFSAESGLANNPDWMTVPCTVLSTTKVSCVSPPFSKNGYGYASTTFKAPPQQIRIYVSLNGHHWHSQKVSDAKGARFSFFDIRSLKPPMSAITFLLGQNRIMTVNVGNFENPDRLYIFCWWKAPGSTVTSAFARSGIQDGGTGNLYSCEIPDWTTIQINGVFASEMLPCDQSRNYSDSTCNLDGSLRIPFGVAFSTTLDQYALRESDFSFNTKYTVYAMPRFNDFLPKMGDQLGGTEVRIYGENFLQLPTLQCRFGDGPSMQVAQQTIFISKNLVICVVPKKTLMNVVAVYLTVNKEHYSQCDQSPSCVFKHPHYKGAQRGCCVWYNSIEQKEQKAFSFTYARRPTLSALQPNSAPNQGDSDIKIIGNNIVAGLVGIVYACLIDGEIVPGYFNVDGGLQYMTCLTRPNMRVGELDVKVSINEFEWSVASQVLKIYEPLRILRINPAFTIWDNPTKEITIIGKNFITPEAEIGDFNVLLAEFDENGVVKWKRTRSVGKYGPKIPIEEPALEPNIVTDLVTVDQVPKRDPCTTVGARFCETGVVNVFVSQNGGEDWTWENVTFTYIRQPASRDECFGGVSNTAYSTPPHDFCTVEAKQSIDGNQIPFPKFIYYPPPPPPLLNHEWNKRGDCILGVDDQFGQAARSGTCICTSSDCTSGAYDCGNQTGDVTFGCSIKAAITNVHPRSGPTSGGTFVQIRGHKIENGTGYWCKFGSQTVPATLNKTHLLVECITPPLLQNRSVEVEISISGGSNKDPDKDAEWTVSHGLHTFHYYTPPTIRGIDPSTGPATGATLVTITAGMTDAFMALDTRWRAIDINEYGKATCEGDSPNGLCKGMYRFGSYKGYGPITPGFEASCVSDPHCEYELYQQHDLTCRFCSKSVPYCFDSVETIYLLPNVIQCKTAPHAKLLSLNLTDPYDDMTVDVTMNGQLWHKSPMLFRVHAYNNITIIMPEAGPAAGGTWVTLIGAGFIDEPHLTSCKFGIRDSLSFKFINSSHVACQSPPTTFLEKVSIFVSFNLRQYTESQQQFEYIVQWKIKKLYPQFAREVGGGILSIIGYNFKDVSAIACKFGDLIVRKPEAVFVSENEMLCRIPKRILRRPHFVTSPDKCDGTYIRGSTRNDTGWTICQGCTDCCLCPDCPDCMPTCRCRTDAVCCSPQDQSDKREFLSDCPPDPPLRVTQPRSLCLPPEYVCQFVSTDETTKVLDCTLLKFKGTLYPPPQPTTMILPDERMDFLHPDLALRLTLPFYMALDGQSWYSGCVSFPFWGNTAMRDIEYTGPPCQTDDDAPYERWVGTVTYIEAYNITRFKPGIAPSSGETPITVIGEGFVESADIQCQFGWKDDGTYDPDYKVNEKGDLMGVIANEVSGKFVNSFTVICVSPPLDTLVYDELTKGTQFIFVPVQISMNGLPMEYSDSTVKFVYSKPWELSYIEPRNAPTIGGSLITFFGPFFYDSGEIMCKFGNLMATSVSRISSGIVVCRTPSVEIHKIVNVSITVDGTSWSKFTNRTVMEYFGVRNVLLFGENDYGQLGFGKVGERVFQGKRCTPPSKYGKFLCTSDDDCPSGNCFEERVLQNREPTFLNRYFARNMTNIAMGQTHTLIIASETYSDDWETSPRRGVVFTWGDNLVGQMGFGFSGPSFKQYNFSEPQALACLPSETYLLDRRLDARTIVGLPEDWPEDGWIVPTCIRYQDVESQGVWRISTFILFNPFYYKRAIQIAAGSFHSMAVTEDNNLWVWGWNNDGQLGMGPLDLRPNIPLPTQVVYFRRKLKLKANIVKIAAGFSHSAAVDHVGRLFTWGSNKFGQLGVGDYLSRRYPTEVTGFLDPLGQQYQIVDVTCGLYHCLALTQEGSVWSWGSNSRGQLGTCDSNPIVMDTMNLKCESPTPVMDNAKVNSRNVPKMIDFLEVSDYAAVITGRPLVTKIATGAFHSMAITTPCSTGILNFNDPCPAFNSFAGDLYVWGNNKYGQLGIGQYSDMTYKQLPYLMHSLKTISSRCRQGQNEDCLPVEDYFRFGKKVINVAGGSWHTLLILEQKEKIGYRRSYYSVNRLFTFGNNDEGQLGHGDTTLRDAPTLLVTNFVKFHDLGGNFYQSLFTQGCPPHDALVCNGNGMCLEQGVCNCYPGFRGQDCAIECDGGHENVCSGHGNNSMAIALAKWRQQVILASSGHALQKRLDRAFTGYVCRKDDDAVPEIMPSMYECEQICTRPKAECKTIQMQKVKSIQVVAMLEGLVSDYPAMITAVKTVREDWPLHMFNQGLRYWKYSYLARGEYLKNTTFGPSDGQWTQGDLYPLLTMLQNRSTCWRTYGCTVGLCRTDPGYTRTGPGESMLDVNAGCRDGWTAQMHFRKRIEEIDQAWSNLEMENPYCDPQVVADKYEIRKEQVQFMWAVFETDPEKVVASMLATRNPKLTYPFKPGADPVQKVLQVWEAFDIHCQNYTLAQIVLGCMLDGTCSCAYGWTGMSCDVPCEGGANSPCNWHGTCRTDGKCICERGWTGPSCNIECSGADKDPEHWPCSHHGHCQGWFVHPKLQLHIGPTDKNEEKYYSIGKGISFFEVGTHYATNGTCRCHYGYRSDWGQTDCALRCPGWEPTFLDELGECFNNGVCNTTGRCECFEGYRNFSCNVECAGGHLIDPIVGISYSNECTAQLVCDVYPDFVITTLDGPKFCRDMDKYDDSYSRDHKVLAEGKYLRVFNGLCQFQDLPPRLHKREAPQPNCPGPEWCSPYQIIAAPAQGEYEIKRCSKPDKYCIEHLSRTRNYTGGDYNASTPRFDPLVGPPKDFGCPSIQCNHVLDIAKEREYPPGDNRFRQHGLQPDLTEHHSSIMGFCYCLSGFRGASCEKKCPGGKYRQDAPVEQSGGLRMFPLANSPQALETEIWGFDYPRGWDTNSDRIPDGVAGRELTNICSGNGFCEEDASCSCYLTDRGPHTNWTDVSGWRGEACEIECPGGATSICSTHGICNDLGQCACFKGYRNDSCQVACLGVRDCKPDSGCLGVCNYAGACLEDGACQCDPAYRGEACELLCPPYSGRPSDICNKRGPCNEVAVCLCDVWYQGEACERIADWVIAVSTLLSFGLLLCVTHCIRRYLYSKMRAKRRARRDRRKVRRTQAAVGRLKAYAPQEPDVVALAAKGI